MNIKRQSPNLMTSSLYAPIAALLVPAILAIIILMSDSSIQNDDAPVRAAGLLLIVVFPITYPILVAFMAAAGYILNKAHRLSLRNLLMVNGLVCIPIAFCFGWSSPFGLKDQLTGLIIFFSLTILCLGIGVVCWWFLAVRHDERVYEEKR